MKMSLCYLGLQGTQNLSCTGKTSTGICGHVRWSLCTTNVQIQGIKFRLYRNIIIFIKANDSDDIHQSDTFLISQQVLVSIAIALI